MPLRDVYLVDIKSGDGIYCLSFELTPMKLTLNNNYSEDIGIMNELKTESNSFVFMVETLFES